MDNPYEAFRIGAVIGGPLCLLASFAFALGLSASPTHNLVGKGLGWLCFAPAAVLVGYYLGPVLLPDSPLAGMICGAGYGAMLNWLLVGVFSRQGFFSVFRDVPKIGNLFQTVSRSHDSDRRYSVPDA